MKRTMLARTGLGRAGVFARRNFSVTLALTLCSCAARHNVDTFRVVPAKPEYTLRSPEATSTPFPEVLAEYTNVGPGWVQLQPDMGLRIENAYYREGAPKRDLSNYIGTETARYRVRTNGMLQQVHVESTLTQHPADQPSVEQLIANGQTRFRHHRYFYQVTFKRRSRAEAAILLSAASTRDLESLTQKLLRDPESTCAGAQTHCTVFPEACTVSLEMEIIVNGTPKTTIWGSTVANVAAHPSSIELLRRHAGRFTPVALDSADPQALRLPLLPGDRLTWR
jgi:hypothetical protein